MRFQFKVVEEYAPHLHCHYFSYNFYTVACLVTGISDDSVALIETVYPKMLMC